MVWLVLALTGGLVGLDGTSFPQVMISRPLVAGTLTGLLFGRPLEGMAVGAVLEAFSLAILPIGAARYPESGTATVAATGAYLAAVPAPDAGLLPAVVLFGLALEWLTGFSVVVMRRVNERFAVAQEDTRVPPRVLERRHLLAMGLDFGRGALLTAAGSLVGYGVLLLLDAPRGFGPGAALGVLACATAVMLGTALPVFGGWVEQRRAFIAGIALGTAFVVLT